MSEPAASWAGRGAAYAHSDVHRHGPSLPKVAALLRPRRTDRILDVGTGTGHTAAFLARWSDDVTGTDPEPDMLAAAARAYGHLPGVALVPGSGERLPFAAATFDAVVARHTLHHHENVAATLSEVHRVLMPGGRFVMVDETSPADAFRPWLERLERTRDPSHLATRSLAAWSELLAAAGFVWIVGDHETRYRLGVDSWLDRMAASTLVRERVRAMLRDATPAIREAFAIEFDGADPVSFALPMNIVLVIKEES